MHRRTSLLAVALSASLLYSARDVLVRPILDRVGASDAEVAGLALTGVTPPPGVATVAKEPPPREPVRGSIGRNSSLYVELRNLGVSAVDIDILTRQTRGTFDWRRVRAGQEFDLYATDTGEVDSLLLYTSVADYVRVSRTGDGFAASVEQVPYEINYAVTHGTIYNSIYASLQEQGAALELAGSIDDVFGWTIDLASDLRAGDEYVLLYELRTYRTGVTTLGNVLAARIVNAGREYNAIRFADGTNQPAYYNLEGQSMQKAMRRAPLRFTHISSSFSGRRFHPVQKVYKPHYGVDYAAPKGTPIYATGDGVVVAAQYGAGNGNFVKIRHNRTYESWYLHMSGFAKGVRRGVKVSEGQLIGYVGSTGYATASHVCYRITRNGSWVNPRTLELPAREPVSAAQLNEFIAVRDSYLSRVHGALMDGLADRTAMVQAPVRSATALRASAF
jgi:murein DD-endopeptidase MepM/ murein hydrolase activator NlpD